MSRLTPEIIKMLARQGRPLSASSLPAPDMWQSEGARVSRESPLIKRPMDALPIMFAGDTGIPGPQVPQDDDGNTPVLINAACPPWVCPPVFAVPVDLPLVECVPWYMVDTRLGSSAVPTGNLLVIKSVSYQALNAVQNDVLRFTLMVDGQVRAEWEDAVADAAQANPANRMALSGHTRELPLHVLVPPKSVVSVSVLLMGSIDFAGVSPKWSGEPILTTDCHVRVLLNGWYFPATNNVEGAPRQGFVGDQGNWLLDDG